MVCMYRLKIEHLCQITLQKETSKISKFIERVWLDGKSSAHNTYIFEARFFLEALQHIASKFSVRMKCATAFEFVD